MKHDDIGARLKEYYENRSKTSLTRKIPVAMRIDGRSFHTFAKHFDKPFDKVLMTSMQDTMQYLCENIPGCVLGYTQSDEISLIFVDYKKLTSAAFFEYDVQKLCSVVASMATMIFNKKFEQNVRIFQSVENFDMNTPEGLKNQTLLEAYFKSIELGATFDARCFNIPKEEVTNLIYWRQLDASRNSVSMVAYTYFSSKELHKKTTAQRQEMLWSQYNVNWNDYPTYCKRGSCCIYTNGGWNIDLEIPMFKGEGRNYVEKLI